MPALIYGPEIDHPRVRAAHSCPLCRSPKDTGLVVCWPCYRQHNLRNGNPHVDAFLDRHEAVLSGQPVVRAR